MELSRGVKGCIGKYLAVRMTDELLWIPVYWCGSLVAILAYFFLYSLPAKHGSYILLHIDTSTICTYKAYRQQ